MQERLALLDDVLERFLPDAQERRSLRDRFLGNNKRALPQQILGDIKEVPARPRFTDRMMSPGDGGSPSSSRGGLRLNSSRKSNSIGARLSHEGEMDRGPATKVRDGKAMLQATSASVAPTLRDTKPLELAADDAHDDADSDSHPDSGGGDGDGGSSDFTLDLMMGLDQESLASLKQHFGKFRNEVRGAAAQPVSSASPLARCAHPPPSRAVHPDRGEGRGGDARTHSEGARTLPRPRDLRRDLRPLETLRVHHVPRSSSVVRVRACTCVRVRACVYVRACTCVRVWRVGLVAVAAGRVRVCERDAAPSAAACAGRGGGSGGASGQPEGAIRPGATAHPAYA